MVRFKTRRHPRRVLHFGTPKEPAIANRTAHGSMTRSPNAWNGATSRVATIEPFVSAVAAM